MKKYLALILTLVMVFALAACGQSAKPAATEAPAASEEPAATEAPAATEEPAAAEPAAAEEAAPAEESAEEAAEAPAEAAVMSYADFTAAAVDDPVCVETYVQAKQSWWDDKATVYTQDKDGAYFLYNMACSEADYAKLVPGQKLRVTGYKAEWSGEVEIVDASFELLDGDSFTATPVDVTDLLGKDELVAHQNQLVSFKGMTVEAYDESGAAFAYKNEADKTDDLYFKVSKDGQTYDFCVEYYLCNEETEVYKAVENLKVGDTVDLEGFLYWYEGPNPHITAVTTAA
jgi:predicted small lipoprotein YifL